MSENSFQQIEKIVTAFSLRNGVVFFGERETGILIQSSDQTRLYVQQLSNIIYDNCYSRCQFSFSAEQTESKKSSETGRAEFLTKLKTSNTTEDSLDRGWTAEDISDSGSVLIAKKESHSIMSAGNYLIQSKSLSEIRNGDRIIVRTSKDFSGNGYFYFVSGQRQQDWWNSGMMRFYWNLKAGGATVLIEAITKNFNRFGIPFSFKCLNDPDSYNRCDSGVLYLANCYLNVGMKLLKLIHEVVTDFLNEDVPLFTLKLAKGISFAENPPVYNISFGQSRSQVIARGLIKAWNENIDSQKISATIRQTIMESNLNPEKFYLNPRSSFDYDFSAFDS